MSVKHFIAVVAGKGGVGKTAMTILLAKALQRTGLRVGILDADIYGPSIANYFEKGEPPGELGDKISPANFSGIQNVSLGYFKQKSKNSSHLVRAPVANAIVDHFIHGIAWDDLDILLVDFPPGTGDVPMTLMQTISFTGAIVVTTPEEIARWDVEKAIEMLIAMKLPILGIIQNKSFLLDGERKIPLYLGDAGKALAEQFSIDLLGEVPFEPGVLESLREKKSWSLPSTSTLMMMMGEIAIEVSRKIWDNPISGQLELRKVSESLVEIVSKSGLVKRYSPSEIQKLCPCVTCEGKNGVAEQLESKILAIIRIGNYGWKMVFSHGCSQGIYPEELFKV